MQPTTYRLVRPDVVTELPTLDRHQQQVVDHPGGPLLVLAGPGTGKTTTLVEAIVDRIEHRGAVPDQVLALTFSRKAAEQLRDRVTARLGRTMSTTLSSTFHSFAYGLIRKYAPAELYEAPLRLLSAPEQDVVLRELLTDNPESVTWPESLTRALGTRGFAREVHAVLSRAREKGLDGRALHTLGVEEGLPEFQAAGLFLDQYLTNLDSQGAIDYADLIRRATIEAEAHRDELRARLRHVFVDEYQDTDPGQVALLRALAGDGRDLTVVGDPHQSIYAFRGAEVRGILDFPTDFPQADGRPADVVALRTTRRFGPRLLVASQRVAHRLALPGSIPTEAREAFLAPEAVAGPLGDGRVVVRTFDTERAEAEHLADLLRRAHLEDGVPWDDMAVLVRSGRTSIPPLRRALGAAGVPVEVASDEVPLVRDPAVLPLIDALRAVVNLDNDEPDHLDHIDPSRAEALLLGPLGGLDAGDVRRLARRLRTREKALSHEEARSPLPSRELVRKAVVDRHFLDGLDGPEVVKARALTQLLVDAREELAGGASAEELLWTLWSRTGWPQRLRRSVDLGGGAARRAHRDLDSVCALFDIAARAEERRDHVGVRAFLATLVAQQIPADTLADRGARGAAVRLLTAHRSKGLEWRLVVIAHVQQDGWPDLRRRSTLLQADRIGQGHVVPPVSSRELLMEERRLFYVAATRARQRLVVTAVASADDEGEQPSRFLDELGVTVEKVVGRPTRPLSMSGLVSELRRTLADPDTSEPLREAAARRLARLAGETVGQRQLVPSADPSTWWGTRAASRSVQPVREPDQPVPVSASVLEGLGVCPTQWFLEREAGGVARAHQSANLGEMVHALAQRVADGELPAGRDDADLLMSHVDQVWERLDFRTPWSRAREHDRVRAALARFLAWHHDNRRTLLATEAQFSTVVGLHDGEQVRLTGYADRLELDSDGKVVVVDLKTGRRPPTNKSVEGHVQLGLYQYAVDHGAVDETVPGAEAGGAELVQLGVIDGGPDALVQRQPVQPEDGSQRDDLRARLAHSAVLLRTETFPAVAGDQCRDCSFVPICPIKSAGPVTSQ
ncbi:superfamily I DNA/RNA helicase/RecB family exonuclease [Nocardioides ginsengisegetis]|uniref:DNA 3'-5' helicase n=1 Tax=Nocardioides ginsengisegetis TaxID=661491 RepID=A0A7W3IXF9_9ACTN|nr:ATP-dependent DNA helicase [Nocardioides ginsengisegetis]MBA8802442.1 superfamily I DNA/RNA helicase/RecB family exonuclease [Nocardioides ginsengisegetis]